MKRLIVFAALALSIAGTARAQTYPPSETTPPPTTPVVCVDCDDLPKTGTGAIGWGAAAAMGLLAIGGTATIIARKRYGRDDV